MVTEELGPRLHHAIKIFPRVALSKGKNPMRLAIDITRRWDDWCGPNDIDAPNEVWKQRFDLHRAVAGQRDNTPRPMCCPGLHPRKVRVQGNLPGPARLLPRCGNKEEGIQHVCDDGCACDERDVVGDADKDIRANAPDSLWDTVTVGDNPIRADIDDAHIPQQCCGGMLTWLSVDENRDVMRMGNFLKTIEDGDGVRFVATAPRVGQRTGIKDDAHRLFRYLSGAMRQSAQGRCTGPGWP